MNDKPRPSQDMDATPRESGECVTPLSAEAQGLISKQLRQVYGTMLAEPMPDKFAKLLEELSKAEPNE